MFVILKVTKRLRSFYNFRESVELRIHPDDKLSAPRWDFLIEHLICQKLVVKRYHQNEVK